MIWSPRKLFQTVFSGQLPMPSKLLTPVTKNKKQRTNSHSNSLNFEYASSVDCKEYVI